MIQILILFSVFQELLKHILINHLSSLLIHIEDFVFHEVAVIIHTYLSHLIAIVCSSLVIEIDFVFYVFWSQSNTTHFHRHFYLLIHLIHSLCLHVKINSLCMHFLLKQLPIIFFLALLQLKQGHCMALNLLKSFFQSLFVQILAKIFSKVLNDILNIL